MDGLSSSSLYAAAVSPDVKAVGRLKHKRVVRSLKCIDFMSFCRVLSFSLRNLHVVSSSQVIHINAKQIWTNWLYLNGKKGCIKGIHFRTSKTHFRLLWTLALGQRSMLKWFASVEDKLCTVQFADPQACLYLTKHLIFLHRRDIANNHLNQKFPMFKRALMRYLLRLQLKSEACTWSQTATRNRPKVFNLKDVANFKF